jgi:hypothetical protein
MHLEESKLRGSWFCLMQTDEDDDYKVIHSGLGDLHIDSARAKFYDEPGVPTGRLHPPFIHQIYSSPEVMDWLWRRKMDPALATGFLPTVSEYLEDIADDIYEDEEAGTDWDWEEDDDEEIHEHEELDEDGVDIPFSEFLSRKITCA